MSPYIQFTTHNAQCTVMKKSQPFRSAGHAVIGCLCITFAFTTAHASDLMPKWPFGIVRVLEGPFFDLDTDTQEDLLGSARRLRMQNRYSEAADLYAQYTANNPKSSRLYEARFWFAKCRLSEQKWDEAAKAFTVFLKHHSDQRIYSLQAKEDRIYCWKLRQKQNPEAIPGLRNAQRDQNIDIRILAALALAENQDTSSRRVLEEGLMHPKFSDQCGLALWKLGVLEKPTPTAPLNAMARMLVVKVKTDKPNEGFKMRVPVNLLKNLEKIMPPEAIEEMTRQGLGDILNTATSVPKGQVLFQFKSDKNKTSVVILVD